MTMFQLIAQERSAHPHTATALFPPEKIKGRMRDTMRLSCLITTAFYVELGVIARCSNICFEGDNAAVFTFRVCYQLVLPSLSICQQHCRNARR